MKTSIEIIHPERKTSEEIKNYQLLTVEVLEN
jgi:hypothetical protein